jgi:integrase
LGVYNPETFTVGHARTAVYALKSRIGNGENIAESLRQQKAQAAKLGVTVDQVIAERVEWMKTPVLKRDGEMRPRIETWSNVESHLRRFVSPRLGRKLANEVSNRDIAQLSDDIVVGQFGKPLTANARHMRRAASAMFTWAAGPSRGYVTASPCIHLEKLDEEYPRNRVLSEDEIRTLWHGLDRDDMPWDRKTRLAIKFALTTMLRSSELLGIHHDELNMDNGTPSVDIPARRVKKRRVINQPLSDLALEIINEAIGNYEYAFTGRFGDVPLARNAMASALRGAKRLVKGVNVTRTPASANCSASRRSRRMIRGARRQRCAVSLVCRRQASRYASTIRRTRTRTASRCQRSPPCLQPRHAGPGGEETRGAGCMGCRASADHRRACSNRAVSCRLIKPHKIKLGLLGLKRIV